MRGVMSETLPGQLAYPVIAPNGNKPHDERRCGAKTRGGNACRRWAMENGRCYLHGGKSTGRPITTGLYAIKHQQKLTEKIEQYMQAPVDDLTHELALVRALLQDLLDKLVASPTSTERGAILTLVDEIRKVVEAINKIRTNTALTGQEIQLFIIAMSSVLKKYVSADDLPEAINELRRAITPTR